MKTGPKRRLDAVPCAHARRSPATDHASVELVPRFTELDPGVSKPYSISTANGQLITALLMNVRRLLHRYAKILCPAIRTQHNIRRYAWQTAANISCRRNS